MGPVSGQVGTKVRVLVVDNSRIHTQLLSEALQGDPGLEVVRWDWDLSNLIPTVLAHNIDVLVISSGLNGQEAHSFDVVRELRAASPATKAIILLDAPKDDTVINAFRAGARGILGKETCLEIFRKCVYRVHTGEIWADNRGVALVVDALASAPLLRAVGANGVNLLSKRELEVVQYVVQGLSNREIADRMGLSQHTIKNYLFRIFDKLGVSSRVELLFMTLSQNNSSEEVVLPEASTKALGGNGHDETTLGILGRAAMKGSPAAQLALAQAYVARRAQPEDLVQAYMWYLIASEGSSQTRSLIASKLTPEQMHEAQQRANAWLAHSRQISASDAKPVARLVPLRPAM